MALASLLMDSLELRVQELLRQVAELQVEVEFLRESVPAARVHLELVRELE